MRAAQGHAQLLFAVGSDPGYAGAGRTAARGAGSWRGAQSPPAQSPGREAGAMTWADFYLICFAVGFAFSLISFLSGGTRWRLPLPHLPHGGAHLPMAAGHG